MRLEQLAFGATILLAASTIAMGAADPQVSVDAHNKYRQMLNDGNLGSQPKPNPRIPMMIWDQATADNAQRHTDQCVWEHSDRADRDNAGENLAAGTSVSGAVDMWVDEEKDYTYPDGYSPATGHYTQVVWETSTRVGCGETRCSPLYDSNGNSMGTYNFVACQYQQAGNYNGLPPYRVDGGEPVPDPTPPTVRGSLGIPAAGSYQSGIGTISGWVCDANEVTIQIDDKDPKIAAYGTSRKDTIDICGDEYNGFGLLWSYNLFGEGEHRIRAYADGVMFADRKFNVGMIGTGEFIRGASGDYLLHDFPEAGQDVWIRWEQANQNFMILHEAR